MKKCLSFILFLFCACSSFAQKVSVQADKYDVKIGQVITLKLQAEINLSAKLLQWPAIGDSIGMHFWVLRKEKIDTLRTPESKQLFQQTLSIASFDTGTHKLPPFEFSINDPVKGKLNLQTDELVFAISLLEVDTTLAIKEIRPLMALPFAWKDYLPYAGIGLGLIALAVIVWWLFVRKKQKPMPLPIEQVMPPWEYALAELNKLDKEQLLWKGMEKSYFVRITEILKRYLERRFNFPAAEFTTQELEAHLKLHAHLLEDTAQMLLHLLKEADMVKFAKGQASDSLKSKSMDIARQVITETIPQKTEPSNAANAG